MSPGFLQIKKLLSNEGGRNLHRQVFIFAGNESWQQDALNNILLDHVSDSLWVGEEAPDKYPFVENKQAQSWLGKEKRVVVFDANKNFDPDSFAAISGIVMGGGLFILLLPPAEKWKNIYSSHFGQRLINSITSSSDIIVVNQDDNECTFTHNKTITSSLADCAAPFFTLDQQSAVESIEKQSLNNTNKPIVLVSDRGRGKSAALGIAAARLIQSGIKNIVITAPRLRATDIIFKHIAEILPDADVTRGKVSYGERVIQFYSPDQLIHDDINADLLLVDEAAAIPVPLLTSFLHRYTQCIFATTVHGYEGTGRGFALRFYKVLNDTNPGWLKLQMKTPIRWAENDLLEKWMFSLLCLDAEIVEPSVIGEVDNNKLEIELIQHSVIAKSETLLNDIFSLLVLAHYRTQPGDLQRILDDETLSIYVVKYNQHVLAIALVSHEGGFPEQLAEKIYRGERRPRGHLLAQALTYHCGVENAATYKYARVMRIAVHPKFQQQGIGTKLLKYIVQNEKLAGYDAIGTSFGMNASLLNFWRQSKFSVMRIGFKREQTSGEHAAIMLLPLNSQGERVYSRVESRFIKQLPFWFEDVLKELPSEIKKLFPVNNERQPQLSAEDIEDLEAYVKYSRNYELCIAALNNLVLHEQHTIHKNDFPENFRQILNDKVLDKKNWKEIGRDMGLIGKDDARKLFQQAIFYLLDNT